MKLSKLVYLCVKGATDYGDASFTYGSFVKGEAEQDQDYGGAIERVFLPINSFFQRLNALGKMPAVCAEFDCSKESKIKTEGRDFGKLVSCFQYVADTYRVIDARMMGKDIVVFGRYDKSKPVVVQFRCEVPSLEPEDVRKMIEGDMSWEVDGTSYDNEARAMEALEETQIDLERFGVTNEIAYLCVDWCKAMLNDDQSLGRAQMIDCESRIRDLGKGEFLFLQNRVERR